VIFPRRDAETQRRRRDLKLCSLRSLRVSAPLRGKEDFYAEAVIVDCLRTAVGKAPRGTLRNSRPDDLGAIVIRALLEKYPAAKDEVEDVILGCAMRRERPAPTWPASPLFARACPTPSPR